MEKRTALHPEIEGQFQSSERQREELIASVCTLLDASAEWSPGGGTWCIRQTILHLALSDIALGQIYPANALPADNLPFRLLPRRWRRAMVLAALNRDKRLPLPSETVEPTAATSLSGAIHQWNAAREEMQRSLDGLEPDAVTCSHPVLGPLSVRQMLVLEATHTAYHGRQIQAMRALRGFPG